MHRKPLIDLLVAYNPTPEEKDHKQLILAFVKEHRECFERELEVGHITASSWLVSQDRKKALLMHHAKLNAWVQLGGHCDGNPDVLEVAIKEAEEESGISGIICLRPGIFDIDIHLIPENPKQKQHFHYDIRFLLGATTFQPAVQNHESKELKWVSQSLPTDSRSVVRMHEKWLQSDFFH